MKSTLQTLLVIFLAAQHSYGIKCWKCSNVNWRSDYDRHCAKEDYNGTVVQCDQCTSCYTYVFDNGKIYRGPESMVIEEPRCRVYSTTTECYCLSSYCNNNHCEQCQEQQNESRYEDIIIPKKLIYYLLRGLSALVSRHG